MNFRNPFKNSVQPEDNSPQAAHFWQSALASMGLGEYSDLVLKMVISPIFDELKKVEFYSDPIYTDKTKSTVKWLNDNYADMFIRLFLDGYVGASVKDGKILFDDDIRVTSTTKYGYELSNNISVSSFEYKFFRKSQKKLLESIFENINTGLTAQKAVTKILGQFTIFSKNVPKDTDRVIKMTDEDKKNLTNKFSALFSGANVGTSVEFTNTDLKRDTIVFPLEKLAIVDNVSFGILIVAGVLNVPYDLIPISGKSTYENQEQAKIYLRTHTVSGIAENMLELGRKIMKAQKGNTLLPPRAIDYRIITNTNNHGAI